MLKTFTLATMIAAAGFQMFADSIADVTPVATTAVSNAAAVETQPSILRLSREECIRIALDDNPTVKIADMEIQRADYSKKETLASLFPKIDFGLNYQRSIELQTIRMNMGNQSTSIKMGTDNAWNMGFSASLPIIAPQLWKSLKISDLQILQNAESARASRLDLVNSINKAYYTLLLAHASKAVLQQNYDNAVLTAEIFEKKFKVGTASEYDVLRSSVQVKNIEPELLQADIAIKQAKLQLKVLTGIAPDVDFDANTTLEAMQRDMYGYTSTIDRNFHDNTSLRSLDLQTRTLQETVNMRKLAWVPTLAATFNLNWSSLSNGNMFKNIDFSPYSNAGFAISVPIFSGGSKYYALRQSEVQLKEMSLRREDLVNQLNMQVDLALDNIKKEVKQIDTNAEGVRQAKKAHEIMQKSFEIGAATYLDLRDSELADTSAHLAYYQAIYNYLVSTSELDTLLGKESALYPSDRVNQPAE